MTLSSVKVCSRTNCDLPIRSRGLCGTHYEAHRSRMIAYGKWESQRVDAAPVRAHYEALLAAGMGRNQVARVSGVKTDQLDNLLRPRKDRGGQPAKIVFRRTADRLLAVPVPAQHEVWKWAADGQRVDPTGTARRLQALVSLGHSQRQLASRLGVDETNLPPTVNADRLVTAGLARRVAGLFDELQWTPGDSVRARNMGARRGWHPPLAWDEDTIDDPAAQPIVDADTDAEVDEVVVDRGVEWLQHRVPKNDSPRYRAWIGERPAMTRQERIAVAHRAVGIPRWVLLAALALRKGDLELEVAA